MYLHVHVCTVHVCIYMYTSLYKPIHAIPSVEITYCLFMYTAVFSAIVYVFQQPMRHVNMAILTTGHTLVWLATPSTQLNKEGSGDVGTLIVSTVGM